MGVGGGDGERESVCVCELGVGLATFSSCLVRKPSISSFRSKFPIVTLFLFLDSCNSLDSSHHDPNDPSSKTTSLENMTSSTLSWYRIYCVEAAYPMRRHSADLASNF